MSKYSIVDIHIQQICEAEIIEHQHTLSFSQFVHACGQNEIWIQQLIEHDILSSISGDPKQHQFLGEDVSRARQAYRLQRDFDASFTAIALMLDMLDEIHALRKRIHHSNI